MAFRSYLGFSCFGFIVRRVAVLCRRIFAARTAFAEVMSSDHDFGDTHNRGEAY